MNQLRSKIGPYREPKDRIDFVVLDMIMPERNAGKSLDELVKINSALIVLLSSGPSIDGQAQAILDRGFKAFIQKPFRLKALSHLIRKTRDEA